jgi:hypothetical protein
MAAAVIAARKTAPVCKVTVFADVSIVYESVTEGLPIKVQISPNLSARLDIVDAHTTHATTPPILHRRAPLI